ncbi:unnamed protein product [Adineta steineri]|uniref:U1-type domain-containing protein n=1 Tax=Adineta steineri TaxID=433720 RepID=A0A815CXT9_9BILA|nr:unnamed protein product [Adineta steineri]
MEMSTFRGPSAEDHHHMSPVAGDSKTTTSTTSLITVDDLITATRKCCTLCNLLLASDLHLQTHLRGTRHNQLLIERFHQKNENGIKKQSTQEEIDTFNTECIAVVTSDDIVRQEMAYNRERKHTMKKRAKKLRLRIIQRSAAYEAENAQRPYLTSTHKARIQRFLNELEKSLNTTTRKEPLNTTNYLACQRILTEFVKIFDTHGYEKDSPLEQRVFFSLNGYITLNRMIELRAECNKPALAPESLIALTVSVYRAATNHNLDNAIYLLNSGKLLTLVESFVRHLNGLKIDDLTTNNEQSESEKLAQIDLVTNLAETLAGLISMYNSIVKDIQNRENETKEDKLTMSRVTDFISYMANVGVLDRIASFFRTVRAVIYTTKSHVSDMIIHCLNLLQQMVDFSKPKSCIPPFGQSSKKSNNDSAQVLNIMKSTNFCEILSLLYGILIHETDGNNNQTITENNQNIIILHEKTITIAINSMILLNSIAVLDLDTFQTTLGEDTISLQLRHVANYILAYCNHNQSTTNDNLLHQIILLIGYYCVLNQDNQCRLAFVAGDSKTTTSTTSLITVDDLITATRKCCTLCNLLLASDLHLQTHLRGTRHNQLLIERFHQKNENGIKKQPTQEEIDTFNTECIVVVTSDDIVRQEMAYNRERKHTMKKRAKKLRLRIIQRSAAYEAENAQRPYLTSTHKARIQRFLNELEKSLNTTTRKEPLNTTNYLACQRILTEFVKIFDTHGYEKDSPLEQRVFFSLNGYITLNRMIELRAECNKPALAPESLIALTVSVYRAATNHNLDNAIYLLNSGKLLTLVESFVRHLNGLKIDDLTTNNEQSESEQLAQIDLVTNLAETLAGLISMYNSMVKDIQNRENETKEDKLTMSRVTDFISYMANVGVLDRIASFFRTVRAVIYTTKSHVSDMIIHCLNLLQQMVDFSKPKSCIPPFGQSSKKSNNDSAQVLNIMKSTNFCEILSLLYGILIHETDGNNNQTIMENNQNIIILHEKTITIAINSMILLNSIAVLDLDTFQTTLGEDTISLQLRHVANYILAYCNHNQSTTNDNLLHQIILLIGYYCVLNQDNQVYYLFI